MEYNKIEERMKLWRQGLGTIPTEYIDYHKALAEQTLPKFKAKGYHIHKQYIDRDGWLDGMRVLFLIVETPQGKLLKLHWKDSHATGEWFEKIESGGSFRHRLEEDKP